MDNTEIGVDLLGARVVMLHYISSCVPQDLLIDQDLSTVAAEIR